MRKLLWLLLVIPLTLSVYGCKKSGSNEYLIKFVDEDGTLLDAELVKKGEVPKFSLDNPTKEEQNGYSYTFDGWDKKIEPASENTTYTAKYSSEIERYSIVYNLNNDLATMPNNKKYYTVEDAPFLLQRVYDTVDKEFVGWFDEEGNLVETIDTQKPKNYVLNARWSDILVNLYFKKNIAAGGDVKVYGNTAINSICTIGASSNDGYQFIGFYTEGDSLIDSHSIMDYKIPEYITTIVAKWKPISYDLTLSTNNNEYGTVIGSGSFPHDDIVVVEAISNPGYQFDGWYMYDVYLESANPVYYFKMPAKNTALQAKWTPNTYNLTTSGVKIRGNEKIEYACGEMINLTTNITTSKAIKWTRSDGVLAFGSSYSFKMTSYDLSIDVSLFDIPYTKSSNSINFGYYPQTLVTNTTTLDQIQEVAGRIPELDGKYNKFYTYDYTRYDYYEFGAISDTMFYLDVDLDEDGRYDYRGVYINKYRAEKCYSGEPGTSNSNQYKNGFTIEYVYWFKYEPIKWDILYESNGKALLVASLVIDSQSFQKCESSDEYEHTGGLGYGNNYALSDIRKWLNEDFYNTAFSKIEKDLIDLTLVDNSTNTTINNFDDYVCENTNDKVFLLSYYDVTTYIEDENLTVDSTDYANAQGFDSSTHKRWILRTPYHNSAQDVATVFGGGVYAFQVDYTITGIRPAIILNIVD